MPEESQSTKANIAWMLLGLLLTLILMNVLIRNRAEPRTPSSQPVLKGPTNAPPVTVKNPGIPSTNGAPTLPVISQVRPFTLTNQDKQPVSLETLLGKPWLADIIFTRCPTICPALTKTLQSLRPALGEEVTFVSLTTDPSFDTSPILKQFAATNGCDTANWHFLTGPKAELMQLAVDDLKLAVQPTEPAQRTNPNDLFVHSSLIILVDAQGRMRAHFEYDATNLVQRVQAALKSLGKDNDR